MLKQSILFSILLFLSIYFHNSIEKSLLNVGMSWTISKVIPYLLYLLLGLFFGVKYYRILKKKVIFKFIFSCICFVIPFSVGFIIHPIFEGDFSLQGQVVLKNASASDFKNDGLSVIAIADCPYCLASIDKLKLIKKRNPNLKIDFIVCTKDKKYIQKYIQLADNMLNVRIADNADSLALTAGWRFPTFIKVQNNQPKYLWSNDQFGVRAIDELEKDYSSK